MQARSLLAFPLVGPPPWQLHLHFSKFLKPESLLRSDPRNGRGAGSPSRCFVMRLALGLLDENTFWVSQRALGRPRSSFRRLAGASARASASDHYNECRKCLAFLPIQLGPRAVAAGKGGSQLAGFHPWWLRFCVANVVVFQMTCLMVDSLPLPLVLPLANTTLATRSTLSDFPHRTNVYILAYYVCTVLSRKPANHTNPHHRDRARRGQWDPRFLPAWEAGKMGRCPLASRKPILGS
ncbi:uncharacterized protein CLUP02_08377 [Colletotrichum lupini]|uniref:Uncharacterized protein n=1 Tax=Colletotrichum lupini TaxID=145971 RepID=A0A9Q8SSQ5_9PEZI|nr:uncharacterized protein CLUP02_08377 [Colletotrichum lupini]UQC82887.1 hypothetical protein CLUP02_08377 [Colletotrichum lupini]